MGDGGAAGIPVALVADVALMERMVAQDQVARSRRAMRGVEDLRASGRRISTRVEHALRVGTVERCQRQHEVVGQKTVGAGRAQPLVGAEHALRFGRRVGAAAQHPQEAERLLRVGR